MESIGLFDAKTHLSELVARAERGEVVVITRHNKPVAKLVPVRAGGSAGRSRTAQRERVLSALEQFEPIALAGVDVRGLIHQGRE
jgi:prevent-host-death family protein